MTSKIKVESSADKKATSNGWMFYECDLSSVVHNTNAIAYSFVYSSGDGLIEAVARLERDRIFNLVGEVVNEH